MKMENDKEALVVEIEQFIQEAMKMHIVQVLADSYKNTSLFEYVIGVGNEVWWMKTQAYQLWQFWRTAKVHGKITLQGSVVVTEDTAKDTARLDFMLEKGRIVSEKTNYSNDNKPVDNGLCVCDVYWIDGMDRLTETVHNSPREAIDAAMVEKAKNDRNNAKPLCKYPSNITAKSKEE